CPLGTYKSLVGDERCASCPLHSAAIYKGSIECPCEDGYYRAPADPKHFPCSQPPSAPQSLLVSFVDQSTVILTWQPPIHSGGRNDTTFRVVCDACSNAVSYVPSHTGFTETKVTISGLNPATTYGFQIHAENGVSSYSSSQFVDIAVTTAASVYHVSTTTSWVVQNVRIITVKSTSIILTWNPPGDPFTSTELYQVRYFKRGEEKNSSTILTKKPESSVSGLNHKTEYGFQ
ncbi:ephrin type-A receptor 7-like, partial [Limulus polyphemus]|uniref:Ephrin type-A receptor 7-like n=1 Tax=Limulus polyphemus TaxID=6850 RepID=A0ABM1RZ49_LIMPO